jgi:hypothetical protein
MSVTSFTFFWLELWVGKDKKHTKEIGTGHGPEADLDRQV